ncbi:MAG: ketose-bisphosphate aldolase [Nocardioides sp.]|uniref:class II fructose-bisphosphate aldolase n=1 Tax=Nocardioides sp. TaxID=35761 RepID=UPI0039E5D372
MTLARTGDLVADARAAGAAVGAFNVITLEHAEAVAAAAEATGQPVILQVSENAVAYHGGRLRPLAAACVEIAGTAGAKVSMHLDHVTSLDLLAEAASAGFASVMYDAGALAYADNLAATRQAVRIARADGLWIEAELGYVGGKPDAPRSAHAPGVRTDPDEAAAFCDETGVDALAVAVGSSHAMTTRTAVIDAALVARLAGSVPVPLVLHGSSGVPDDQLRAAMRAGIAKVNVGTALNVAMTGAVSAALAAEPELVDPRRYLASAREAMHTAVCQVLAVLSDQPPR